MTETQGQQGSLSRPGHQHRCRRKGPQRAHQAALGLVQRRCPEHLFSHRCNQLADQAGGATAVSSPCCRTHKEDCSVKGAQDVCTGPALSLCSRAHMCSQHGTVWRH